MRKIKNIVFDLGGVLLDIDYHKSVEAFKQLGITGFEVMFSKLNADKLFENLEMGKISEQEFYTEMKKRTGDGISSEQITDAWNALILHFRTESLEHLQQLSESYQLFLLSNTNSIHLDYFQDLFTRETGKPLLDNYFTKVWYSHKVGLRKPNKDIFEFILADANINPEETLFIDDTLMHIQTAKSLGLHTHHLLADQKIEDILIDK